MQAGGTCWAHSSPSARGSQSVLFLPRLPLFFLVGIAFLRADFSSVHCGLSVSLRGPLLVRGACHRPALISGEHTKIWFWVHANHSSNLEPKSRGRPGPLTPDLKSMPSVSSALGCQPHPAFPDSGPVQRLPCVCPRLRQPCAFTAECRHHRGAAEDMRPVCRQHLASHLSSWPHEHCTDPSP